MTEILRLAKALTFEMSASRFNVPSLQNTDTFWIPLLFHTEGIIVIVTPLNILGQKNQKEVEELGFLAINLCIETATDEAFKDIKQLKYRVIAVSPERLLTDSRFQTLWNEWGEDFRPVYSQLGNIRWYLPDHVTVHVVSATMPPHILADVISRLRIQPYNLARVTRSNNRPNISIIVEEMMFPRNTMHDLTHLPGHLREKVIWFHSGMTMDFRVNAMEKLRKGELWGICCTDAAGMGLDLRDVKIIVQWGYTASLCALLQRLGCGARHPSLTAIGIYLVEPKHQKTSNSQPNGLPSGVENDREDMADSETEGGEDSTEAQIEMVAATDSLSCLREDTQQETTADVWLFPDSLDNAARERFAMYAFINARHRGFCRRRVTIHYMAVYYI
ncbi:P-loop containing nucleoside triphosphate hydrolase protein [Suillus subluteus]|nr:P-loop containing nucleoside triphosphate hydrolase protein [Suillus subluteus]KAG1840035.1 P-loop containing nucleoside triphosphate hydrolase protein [Suillus subluteus]